MLFDSHSHLDAPEFDADRDAVLARARAAGVAEQMVPAIDAASWPALLDLCAREDGLYPALGMHPLLLDRHRDEHLHQLRIEIERARPHAIGECGLDYYVDGLDPERQRHFFVEQLKIARDHDLPVVVHARRAVDEVGMHLRRIGGLRGVVHSFAGSEDQAQRFWKLGFHLGIGGPVTYPRAQRLRGIVATMPLEWLLLETDSPDQPAQVDRGARNEPARMVEVLRVVAELRGVDEAVIAEATTANARRVFGVG